MPLFDMRGIHLSILPAISSLVISLTVLTAICFILQHSTSILHTTLPSIMMPSKSPAKSLFGSNRPALIRRPAVLQLLLVLVLGTINPAASAGLFSVRHIDVSSCNRAPCCRCCAVRFDIIRPFSSRFRITPPFAFLSTFVFVALPFRP